MFENSKRNRIKKKIQNKKYITFEQAKKKINDAFENDEELLKLAIIKYEDSFTFLTSEEQEKYYLKYQNEISIDRLSEETLLKVLKEHSETVKHLSMERKKKIIDKMTQGIEYNRDYKLLAVLLNTLPFEEQYKIYESDKILRKRSYLLDEKLIYKYLQSKQYGGDYGSSKTVDYADEVGFNDLSKEVQKEILKIDFRYSRVLSKEVLIEMTKDNPYLKQFLEKLKVEVPATNENSKSIVLGSALLNEGKYEDIYNMGMDFCKNLSLYYNTIGKIFIRKIKKFGDFHEIFKSNPKDLKEFARFNPEIMLINKETSNNFILKANQIINCYLQEVTSFPNARDFEKLFDDFKISINESYYDHIKNQTLTYTKVLLNQRIMSMCDPTSIYDFIREPNDRTKLLNIIEKAYGKDSRDILENRPEITINEIPNFDIFDSQIIEKLGAGIVHNALSYDGSHRIVLGELGRNHEMLQRYINFQKVVEKIFTNEAIDLVIQMLAFYDFDTSFGKMDVTSLTESQKANLILYLNYKYRMDMKSNRNVSDDIGNNFDINISSIEELNEYESTKNKKMDEILEKIQDVSMVKDLLFQRFFGIKYNEENVPFCKNSIDIVKIIKQYNSQKFVESEIVKNSGMFTEVELDILRLVKIVSDINSVEEIKQIYERLKEKTDMLNPNLFRDIVTKMDKLYSLEMQKSIISKQELDKIVESKIPGIEKREEDGIEIYTLNGADFKMLVHNPFMHNSNININRDNSLKQWETFEYGCSTISCCYIEPALTDIYSIKNMGLGFSDFDYRQIVGMCPKDALADHARRKISPDVVHVSYEFPDELGRRTAAQICSTLDENLGPYRPYNEVVLYRRFMDTSKIEKNGNGGRLMPDYIVIYNKDAYIHYYTDLARKFAKDGKPLPIVIIDQEKYKSMTSKYERAYRGYNPNIKQQPIQTKFIQEILGVNVIGEDILERENKVK